MEDTPKQHRLGVPEHFALTERAESRPDPEECWSEFWNSVAAAFANLPPEVQQSSAERAPAEFQRLASERRAA